MLYLHLNNIIHRDLKPANILLDKFLHPKVADFGLSKIDFQSVKSISKIKGTPKYISPEIWNKYEYTKSCDTYAFGIIMFEILTLENPFEKIDYFQLQIKVCQGYRPEFNSFPNKAFQNLIEKCWSQEPTNRPTFQQIVYQLKNDNGFILESADKKEFLNYVNFIDESKIYYDSFNTSINVENNIDDNLSKVFKLINQSSTLMLSCFKYEDSLSLEDETFNIIKKAENDPKKKFLIGVSLIEGRKNYPQNSEAGILYLQSSILDGYADAIIYYFNMLIKGSIIPKNLKKAKKLIHDHTKQNDELFLLLNGKIMKKEDKYEDALNFFQKASELGNREALYEYGKMLLKGKGIKSNKEEAIKFFKMAIQKDSPQAMLQYGLLLNNEESFNYIKKAADKGYLKAINVYISNISKIDPRYAFPYYKKASDKGDPSLMYIWAQFLSNIDKFKERSRDYY